MLKFSFQHSVFVMREGFAPASVDKKIVIAVIAKQKSEASGNTDIVARRKSYKYVIGRVSDG